MGGARHDHSINEEPHLRQQSFTPDTSEDKAARRLARDRAGVDPDEERARHSVFDEPAILPNRPPLLIDRDWTCRNCGYNLRGLMTGHRCPECGNVELYEPPRKDELTYASWSADHEGWTASRKSWLIAALVPVFGIPFGLICAMVTVEYAGVVNFVVFGPVMAEVLKVAVGYTVIERRGFLIRRAGQIYWMALGTAVVFAIVQNVVYLTLYFRNAPIELVTYRWFAGVPLHAMCTLIAARGLVSIWEHAILERRAIRLTGAYPSLIAAIVLHAVFNACVFIRGYLGYGF